MEIIKVSMDGWIDKEIVVYVYNGMFNMNGGIE